MDEWTVLPENASLSGDMCSFFRWTTLSGTAVATSEVGPAVLLFVAEVCEVSRPIVSDDINKTVQDQSWPFEKVRRN